MEASFTRRGFLRVAAGAAVVATGVGCSSGSDKPKSSGSAAKAGAKGERTLRIAQWPHPVPAYDTWFDNEYTKRWGEEHDVEVVVDHIPYEQLTARADTEMASRRGHDIFGFAIGPPARFEDAAIDHGDIVEEARRRVGPLTPHVERSIRNGKTGRYFAVCDFWTAGPALYRSDLWSETGLTPATWDDVLRAAPALKADGHPIGIGFAPDGDSHLALSALMFSYGASIQDEQANVTIGRAAMVEAVKVGVEVFRTGMTPDVFNWDGVADNRALASGQASLILDPVSGLRATEKQDPALARTINLARSPAGPAGTFGLQVLQSYVIWDFAEQGELAEKFLVDLVTDYREPFLRSEFYNLPAFSGAVPDLGGLLAGDLSAEPQGKYSVLADAAAWSTNAGHPGHDNAAIDEVVTAFHIPRMFAAAARGEKSAEEAVASAEAQIKPIFEKWRERGKIREGSAGSTERFRAGAPDCSSLRNRRWAGMSRLCKWRFRPRSGDSRQGRGGKRADEHPLAAVDAGGGAGDDRAGVGDGPVDHVVVDGQ
jgi:multiple sugar transport system substrate-binding protein